MDQPTVCCLCHKPFGAGDGPVMLSTQAPDTPPCAHQTCAWDHEHEMAREREIERHMEAAHNAQIEDYLNEQHDNAGREA